MVCPFWLEGLAKMSTVGFYSNSLILQREKKKNENSPSNTPPYSITQWPQDLCIDRPYITPALVRKVAGCVDAGVTWPCLYRDPGRHWIGGEGGGQYWMRTKKVVLAWFHIFFKSPMLEKPISFLRKLVSFWKCIQQTGPTDWKQKKVFWQSNKVFCKTLYCFANTLTIVITY